MELKSVVAFCLAVSLVCTVVNCRPRDDGVKGVKGAKILPPAFVDGDRFGVHAAAGSGSTVDGSFSGSHAIQGSSDLGRVSDTLTPGIRGDAGDHEAGLGGISATEGLGIGGNAEPGTESATGLHEDDSNGAGSHGISGNTELGGSGFAGSHGLGGIGIKNSDGGEMNRDSISTGLGSVNGTGTPGLDIHGEIDAKTGSHGVYVSGSDLMGGAGIHAISGNTEHGGSGVVELHELGDSSVQNAGSAGDHSVSGSRGHEGSTVTGVQIFGTNTRCSSGRTTGNAGGPGNDERRGHDSASENGAHVLGDSDTDKSGGLDRNVSGHKNIITGTDGFVLGGAREGSGNRPEEFHTEHAGGLDGSTHGFGIVDSAAEETSTFSGSSTEAYSEMSSESGVVSVNGSDSGSHAGAGSQPGVSGSGSSFSLSHSSSGSEVKGGKKLPVGVKG